MTGLKLALSSVPFLTLVFLLIIDLLLRLGNPVDFLGFRTVDEWNLPPRLEMCRRISPEVALVGSSMLLVLNQDEDGTKFYSGTFPTYFQQQLRAKSGVEVTCVNLCTGLQVPSEAYLISEALLAQKDYPRVIIFGVALRDFIHDVFGAEWSGNSFNSVAPYVPMTNEVLDNISNWVALRELVLCHYSYLYRNRTDFKKLFSGVTKDLLDSWLRLDRPYPRLGADHLYHRSRQGLVVERWVPRQHERFTEMVYRTHPENLKEYFTQMQSGIYRQGSETTMKIQTHYLERLIARCKEKGVVLVLVNMPLSPEMSQLVPPGLYDAFRSFLSNIASKRGIPLIDLFGDKAFLDEDFKDGVHLTFLGARKLSDAIVRDFETRHPAVLETIRQHSR